jgi:hypothetical protein
MRNLDDPQPAAVTGPETLTPRDIADALARLHFRNGKQVIAIDREARNYLLAAVRARIGDSKKRRPANAAARLSG